MLQHRLLAESWFSLLGLVVSVFVALSPCRPVALPHSNQKFEVEWPTKHMRVKTAFDFTYAPGKALDEPEDTQDQGMCQLLPSATPYRCPLQRGKILC